MKKKILYILKSIWTKQYPDRPEIEEIAQENNEIAYIKPLEPLSQETLSMFDNWSTGGNEKGVYGAEIAQKKPHDYKKYQGKFKNVKDQYKRMEILYYYLKDKTENGIFKKESNTIIGEFFGCGRDLISDTFKSLLKQEYISQVNELELAKELKERASYYKFVKEFD